MGVTAAVPVFMMVANEMQRVAEVVKGLQFAFNQDNGTGRIVNMGPSILPENGPRLVSGRSLGVSSPSPSVSSLEKRAFNRSGGSLPNNSPDLNSSMLMPPLRSLSNSNKRLMFVSGPPGDLRM
jgi:hypothetical protein